MKISCNFCKKSNLIKILDLGKTPLANSYLKKQNLFDKEKTYPLKIFLCQKCYLMQAPHKIHPKKFFDDYDYLSGISDTWKIHCKQMVNDTVSKFKLKNKIGTILEIASNDGTLLNYFKKKKFDCLGIEPSKKAAKIAKKNKIKTLNTYLNSNLIKKIKHYNFQLIIANNVIAHVLNINDFVKSISILCNKNSIVSIEFPHLENLFTKMQFDTIYHEHHYYFNILSLKNILSKYNMEIFDYKKINIHGGSIRVFARKKIDNVAMNYKIENYIKKEKKFLIKIIKNKNFFQKKVNKIKKNINFLIKKIKFNNKKIHAYGAAAKGNTFLNFCKINNMQIPIIYDKNKIKQNKFLPGSKIKILSPNNIKILKPDYILILVWNIKKEIMHQLKFIKNWKGKFITMIPREKIY